MTTYFSKIQCIAMLHEQKQDTNNNTYILVPNIINYNITDVFLYQEA